MKERILCRKVMAWLMTAFMVITCLISIGGKNTAYAAAMENIKVTDVDISTDGHLRGLKWGVDNQRLCQRELQAWHSV